MVRPKPDPTSFPWAAIAEKWARRAGEHANPDECDPQPIWKGFVAQRWHSDAESLPRGNSSFDNATWEKEFRARTSCSLRNSLLVDLD